MKLEHLTTGTTVRGILPDGSVAVVSVQWHGSDACTLVYHTPEGRISDEMLCRHAELRLGIVEAGRPWSFDGPETTTPSALPRCGGRAKDSSPQTHLSHWYALRLLFAAAGQSHVASSVLDRA